MPLFIAAGNQVTATSTDGINWTVQTNWPQGINTENPIAGYSINALASNGTLFAAVMPGEAQVATTTDGINWSFHSLTGGWNTGNDIKYGNGLWVAVGYTGGGPFPIVSKIQTSPDGEIWTEVIPPDIRHLKSVCYNGSLWVVGGSDGILTSPDGTNWTQQTFAPGFSVYAVSYGNNYFVAVGAGGGVATSPDGITWTAQTGAHGTDAINEVTYSGSIFVAVGDFNKVSTSPDGITWTAQTGVHDPAQYIEMVEFGHGIFVIGAYSSIDYPNPISTSTDGITWTARPATNLTEHIFAIASDDYTELGGGGVSLVTWNPDDKQANITLSNNNLTATSSVDANGIVRATEAKTSGKYYFEVTIDDLINSNGIGIGVATPLEALSNSLLASNSWGYWSSGKLWHDYFDTVSGIIPTAGDVVGVAVDMDAGGIWWSVNGSWLGSGNPGSGTGATYTNLAGKTIYPAASTTFTGNSITANFGGPFAYALPSGFLAWGPEPPADSFSATLAPLLQPVIADFSADFTVYNITGNLSSLLQPSIAAIDATHMVSNITGNLTALLQPTAVTIGATFTIYKVVGLVREQGTPVSRTVRAYRRDTGVLLSETTSAGDGTFTIYLGDYTGEVYVVALDDANVSPDFNALIYDRVIPVT